MYADLRGADLRGANILQANLAKAKLGAADLRARILVGLTYQADLCEANLSEASLGGSLLLNTLLNGADLTACHVYGVSAWGIHLEGAKQTNLVITPSGEPPITVDNLEVAQFIYLLLNNEKIRDVIDTITSKVVLILGGFTPDRKAILDALRDTLREHNYLPVVFDFDKPASRDLTETVSTLAHLARFIIADITDPRASRRSCRPSSRTWPCRSSPSSRSAAAVGHVRRLSKKYHWVLEAHEYTDLSDLLTDLQTSVIAPAEAKAKQLAAR